MQAKEPQRRTAEKVAKGIDVTEDLLESSLVALGLLGTAGALGLELLAAQARHQQLAEHHRAAAEFHRQLKDLQQQQAAAEALGRHGRQDVERLQWQQVQMATDAAAFAARPSHPADQSWSFLVVCFAIICQLLLSFLQRR